MRPALRLRIKCSLKELSIRDEITLSSPCSVGFDDISMGAGAGATAKALVVAMGFWN